MLFTESYQGGNHVTFGLFYRGITRYRYAGASSYLYGRIQQLVNRNFTLTNLPDLCEYAGASPMFLSDTGPIIVSPCQ